MKEAARKRIAQKLEDGAEAYGAVIDEAIKHGVSTDRMSLLQREMFEIADLVRTAKWLAT